MLQIQNFRRDMMPTESEILTSRLIDRTIRPLFGRGFGHDVQITCDTLSLDPIAGHDPRVAAANAAATALTLSDTPWAFGPAAVVRVIAVNNSSTALSIIVNPTRREATNAMIDVLVGGASGRRLIMLDGHANNIADDLVARCIEVNLLKDSLI